MHIIIKIILAIAMAIFWIYVGLHKGRSLGRKDLPEDERDFLTILEVWFMFSLIIIAGLLFY
jgi:hypothetical protein